MSECKWGHAVSDMQRLHGLLGQFWVVLVRWNTDTYLLNHEAVFWRWCCLSEHEWSDGIPELYSGCQLHRLLGKLLGVLWRYSDTYLHDLKTGQWGW